MDIEKAIEKAEEVYKKYNPGRVTPFPFESVEEDIPNLRIAFSDELPSRISGAIAYDKEKERFIILINPTKSKTRQYFTLAHELGHYMLHAEHLKQEELIVDHDNIWGEGNILYREDNGVSRDMEIEANNFAASLIMPEDLVRKSWKALQDVDECADLFQVSTLAMSIRLERLRLTD